MPKRETAAEVTVPSGTVTFLFSDIEGSTKRWARDRAAMQAAVREHDRLMRVAIGANGGFVFKTIGDAFCAVFATPESAAGAALDAQRALVATDFSAVDGLRVRMALNTGTADERDGDYFGPTLNRVARLLALGHGGQVLLTSVAAGLVRENPPASATLADLGEHPLKDLEGLERVYQLLAPELQRDFPELRARKAAQPWLVPDAMRTHHFSGREDLLARIRQRLEQSRRVAISGLGGAGKTQTAIEYAARHRAEYPAGVFWVDAETVAGLISGFIEIAKELGLAAAQSNDQDSAVKAALEWLNANAGWLLILDNVEDRSHVRSFIPREGNGDLLITSRESVFPDLGIPRALDVGELEDEAALHFLLARTDREDAPSGERTAAIELAAELGWLPLALEQAAAYIVETGAEFAAYLGAFRKRRLKVLEKSSTLVSRDTVAVTWLANFEAVEHASPAASEVLRISALLAPDGIPFELFLDGAHALGDRIAEALEDPDDLTMAEVLRPLSRYSLVRSNSAERTFGVHRLVQEIVWAALGEAERGTYLARAALALDAAFPAGDFPTWARCERLVAHAAKLSERLDACEAESASAVRVVNRAGRYLFQRGRFGEALVLHERALTASEHALGRDHLDLARSLNDLGNVHWAEGRYAQAAALHERALGIRERVLEPDHVDIAYSLHNLSNVRTDLAQYAEAQALVERELAILERTLGPEHAEVALGLHNLGRIFLKQGRYADAQRMTERALAIRGGEPAHPETLSSLNLLASCLQDQQRFEEALPLLERALQGYEGVLGPDHPDTAHVLYNLGVCLAEMGRYAEAQAFCESALAIRQRAFGCHHADVGASLYGLAKVQLLQGRDDVARPLLERSLATLERLHVNDVSHTVVHIELALLNKKQGRIAEAIGLYERALLISEQRLASGHPELEAIRGALAELTATLPR